MNKNTVIFIVILTTMLAITVYFTPYSIEEYNQRQRDFDYVKANVNLSAFLSEPQLEGLVTWYSRDEFVALKQNSGMKFYFVASNVICAHVGDTVDWYTFEYDKVPAVFSALVVLDLAVAMFLLVVLRPFKKRNTK